MLNQSDKQLTIASCGIICDICSAFQRSKNRCVGCNNIGNKPNQCNNCSLKYCSEREVNPTLPCYNCTKFPCKRLKDLDKRYRTKYGESPIENLQKIKTDGLETFIATQKEAWRCGNCGQLLCVHKSVCLVCGSKNNHYPQKLSNKTSL